MGKGDEAKVRRLLIGFAMTHSLIGAVYRGHCPEDNSRVYYFLTNSPRYNRRLEDYITELDLKIAQETKHECSLMCLPISPGRAGNVGFLDDLVYVC